MDSRSYVGGKLPILFRIGWAKDWTWGATKQESSTYLSVPIGFISCKYNVDDYVFHSIGIAFFKFIFEILISK